VSILQEQEISHDTRKLVKIVDVTRLFGKQVEGIAWRKRGYLPEAARRLMSVLAPDAPIGLQADADKEPVAAKG
jgi:hypothetical protein